jgi:transcriptional regulator with XRE-family HTH domain
MKQQTDYERLESESATSRRLLREEELIVETTELLAGLLVSDGISRTELAARLGRTKGFVSQILSGGRNLTLRTLASVADAMGYRVAMRAVLHEHTLSAPMVTLVSVTDDWAPGAGTTDWPGQRDFGARRGANGVAA